MHTLRYKTTHTVFTLLTLLLLLSLLLGLLSGCKQEIDGNPLDGVETTIFTDSAGRDVEIPQTITTIAASGTVAQMILLTIAPDMLVGLASEFDTVQQQYFPEYTWNLPTFGQFYSGKSSLNMEALLTETPQIVIDLGDPKDSVAEDMDSIEEQTGIPAVYINATLRELPAAYRTLGQLLHREEKAEELAQFIEKTLTMADANAALIPESERLSVLYGTGSSGLDCNAAGSSQADVIELIGAVNAIIPEEVTSKSGGTTVNLEQVYSAEPDVIILSSGGPYDTLADSEWSGLTAVQNGSYYEIPNLPYNWMSSPPSVNRVLGIWWLGNLLYPELYDYDMVAAAQEYYQLFYDYNLSQSEAESLLSRSTLK